MYTLVTRAPLILLRSVDVTVHPVETIHYGDIKRTSSYFNISDWLFKIGYFFVIMAWNWLLPFMCGVMHSTVDYSISRWINFHTNFSQPDVFFCSFFLFFLFISDGSQVIEETVYIKASSNVTLSIWDVTLTIALFIMY